MKKFILIIAIFTISPLSSYAYMSDKEIKQECNKAKHNLHKDTEYGKFDYVGCLHNLIRKGDINATFKLGMLYRNGTIIKKDLITGVIKIKESAQKGFAPAQYQLAKIYHFGTLGYGGKDDNTALLWLNKAIAQHYKPKLTTKLLHMIKTK